jgi:polygalacturonase
MKRYNSEDYYSVINKKTGIKIADCAQQEDALLMVSFDPQNRIITTNKFLMGQVVDVVMPKALPTTEIVVHMDGAVGDGSWRRDTADGSNGPGPLPQIKLPESQLEIFNP